MATRQRLGVTHDLAKAVLGQGRPGRAAVGRGRLDLGLGKAVLGLDRSDLGPDGQEEGLPARKGVVMTRMQLGEGFQANMGLGKENFGLGLQDLRKME